MLLLLLLECQCSSVPLHKREGESIKRKSIFLGRGDTTQCIMVMKATPNTTQCVSFISNTMLYYSGSHQYLLVGWLFGWLDCDWFVEKGGGRGSRLEDRWVSGRCGQYQYGWSPVSWTHEMGRGRTGVRSWSWNRSQDQFVDGLGLRMSLSWSWIGSIGLQKT